MCFPQNMGPHLSIDETSLSNGELYTIITNKAGHGRKGTLVAMLKGTRSEDICNLLLRHLPEGRRRGVRTITLDMAGSMARIARTCFPLAKQIIDRFHVQKEFKEALQDLRVQYRWQVMEDENRKMKEAKKQNSSATAKAPSPTCACSRGIRNSGQIHRSVLHSRTAALSQNLSKRIYSPITANMAIVIAIEAA